jgi:hypothetical protein
MNNELRVIPPESIRNTYVRRRQFALTVLEVRNVLGLINRINEVRGNLHYITLFSFFYFIFLIN